MSDIAIRVEGLSKAYRLGASESRPETLLEAMLSAAKSPLRNFRRLKSLDTFATEDDTDDILWALKDVSFDIKQGEVVGFVGRNGAGKSTLLKVLSRITEPTSGRIEIHGRVSSLLEVGTGFHSELTGRENVYMNGTILGMKKAEIDAKFDEIVDFSGVERFLDTPVKRYSSGMKVRLAFAVAAHLEPEILIVDEVLAVGDAEFQKKCLGKMQDVAGGGRTVLFVSHNMGAVQNLCEKAIALQSGAVVDQGQVGDVVSRYLESTYTAASDDLLTNADDRPGSGQLRFTSVRQFGDRHTPVDSWITGNDAEIEFCFTAKERVGRIDINATISNGQGLAITTVDTSYDGKSFYQGQGDGKVYCRIPCLALPIGSYKLSCQARSGGVKLDHVSGVPIDIVDSSFFESGVQPKSQYNVFYCKQQWVVDDCGVGTE